MSRTGPRGRRTAIAVLVAVVLAAGAACGSDDGSAGGVPSTTVEATGDDVTTTTPAAEGDGTDDDSEDGAVVTSEAICAAVPSDAVAGATGLDVTEATPSPSSTPQCAYSYASANGPDSNLTVAASRYTSSDAQSIEEAFDSTVQINLATAGGTSVDRTEFDAGDEALVLWGTALDLGVLRVDDVLVSLIVPSGTITPAQAEMLMVAIADGFA